METAQRDIASPRLGDGLAYAAGALSFGAAGIHFSIIGAHFAEYWAFGVFFVLLSWFQVCWGLGILVRRSTRWMWLLGGGVNLAVVGIYVLSRTKGLPIGPEHWSPESAQFSDVLCTCFEAGIAVLAAVALRPAWSGRPVARPATFVFGAVAAILVASTVSWSLAVTPMEGGNTASAAMPARSSQSPNPDLADLTDPTGMAGMDMSSSSTAADTGWKYTGPTLPASEVTLLTRVTAATDKGHAMQTSRCTVAPTAAQSAAAMQLVQSTSAAVAKYRNLAVAKADGYVAITDPAYPVVHYIKAAAMGKAPLDPNQVQSLVYAKTARGWVLAAAMYMTQGNGVDGPMPGGCLTQWHAHTNLCISNTTHVIEGFAPCAPGSFPIQTPEMLHVWQVPVPGGPLALDPSDLQVVEAATMASGG
ncbi:MAG TPA: hypothetical protein VMT43_02815 [Acidimicrobiales bacterium]|nr:hypothetical protein [Acidimicrobiales bacterium]